LVLARGRQCTWCFATQTKHMMKPMVGRNKKGRLVIWSWRQAGRQAGNVPGGPGRQQNQVN